MKDDKLEFIPQNIQGVFLIKHKSFIDERGIFLRTYCKDTFIRSKVSFKICQANLSINHKPFTLRGFHYQRDPFGEKKIIKCFRGRIFDIVVDIRKNSSTYGKWLSFDLNKSDNLSLCIPKGCANAFLTLEENTIIHYYSNQNYNFSHQGGIRYNDSFFNFKWVKKPIIISEQDKNWPDFNIKNSKGKRQ